MTQLFTATQWTCNEWDGEQDVAKVLGTFTSEDKALEFAHAWQARYGGVHVTVQSLDVDPTPVPAVVFNTQAEIDAASEDELESWIRNRGFAVVREDDAVWTVETHTHNTYAYHLSPKIYGENCRTIDRWAPDRARLLREFVYYIMDAEHGANFHAAQKKSQCPLSPTS